MKMLDPQARALLDLIEKNDPVIFYVLNSLLRNHILVDEFLTFLRDERFECILNRHTDGFCATPERLAEEISQRNRTH